MIQGELKSHGLNLPEFDKTAFKKALDDIKMLVAVQPANFKEQLQEICARCGVAVLYTSCLPKAPISGATWWKRKNPIIQLTRRYKTNDSFWFAFYHEAGHILKHGKKDIFLEDLKGSPVDIEKEKEADLFAQKELFPPSAFTRLISKPFGLNDILAYAKEYHTHPAIIIGQLQHAGIIEFSQWNHLKVPVDLTN